MAEDEKFWDYASLDFIPIRPTRVWNFIYMEFYIDNPRLLLSDFSSVSSLGLASRLDIGRLDIRVLRIADC